MRPPPVSRSALLQVAASALVVVFVMVMVTWLQRSAPTAGLIPLDLADEAPADEFASCERTLPGDNATDPEAETPPGPVGRVSSTEVLQCPRRFDGRLVTFVGEAVGDVLRRDGGAWVQLNDDAYGLEKGPLPGHREFAGTNSGLAVWLPDDLVDLVQRPGRRGVRGDVLQVEGFLRRVDPDDGGGLTIRATDGVLLSPARELDQPVHRSQMVVAGVLALLAIGLVIRERRAREEH